jgi:dTDP-4-amino-4,6-dideoxygalactose transaminase
MNPFQVVRDFERAVAEYTGAPYVVAVNSCTSALMLAVAWHLRLDIDGTVMDAQTKIMLLDDFYDSRPAIEIPKRTYLSVPMSIIHAGGRPTFRDEEWEGAYQLKPLPVWDSARWFDFGMYGNNAYIHMANNKGAMVCTSHHWSKTLGIQQGGCILHDDPEADAWLRRARFDGRTEGVAPINDTITQVGWHCYMSPEVAAEGLVRLHHLPKHNAPLPNDDYPDLSQLEIFQ